MNHFSICSSVALSTFTLLYDHHPHPSPGPSILPNGNRPHYTLTAPGIHLLLPVSMDLTPLGTSYKWDHAVPVLLCPVYVPQHNVLRVHRVAGVRIPSFLRLNRVPLSGHVVFIVASPFLYFIYKYEPFPLLLSTTSCRLHPRSPEQGCLNLCTVDIWDQIILCRGGSYAL